MSSPSTCTEWRRASLAAALIALPAAAPAAPLEKLLMPGPLARAHAGLEDDCAQCHESFSRGDQAKLCRNCHEAIDRDIVARQGFHGRSPAVAGKDCHDCHSDHKGADADIVGLKPALFDHRQTDFRLAGAHAVLACDACHTAGKPHRETPTACLACHRKDDVHAGRMGQKCQDCHSADSWRKPTFDHDKTAFPLRERHAEAACAACHPDRKYEGTTTSCVACHGQQDPHGGLFGPKCADCHGAQAWTKARFDHARTKFPLAGRHRTTGCHSCHTAQTRGKAPPTDCVACHRASDIHQGRLGTQCGNCHGPERWTPKSFDHDKDTAFPLRGRHEDAACASCHDATPAAKSVNGKTRACVDCHRDADPHRGQQGARCDACHDESSWSERVAFDHDLSRFPLLGLHAVVPCAECHRDEAYRSTPTACVACHAGDDPHRGGLGPQCQGCHATTGWALVQFDHARRTRFPLDGAHQALRCADCHRTPAADVADLRTAATCASCHASDDVHEGGFGADCGRCHQTTSFRGAHIRRRGPEGR